MTGNIAAVLSDSRPANPPLILNNHAGRRIVADMKQLRPLLVAGLIALAATLPAQAACYADYKAKRDNPLRLHYGVIELPDSACGGAGAAAGEISRRISRDGWTLLNVMAIFGSEGLAERRESAGQFYLRY